LGINDIFGMLVVTVLSCFQKGFMKVIVCETWWSGGWSSGH